LPFVTLNPQTFPSPNQKHHSCVRSIFYRLYRVKNQNLQFLQDLPKSVCNIGLAHGFKKDFQHKETICQVTVLFNMPTIIINNRFNTMAYSPTTCHNKVLRHLHPFLCNASLYGTEAWVRCFVDSSPKCLKRRSESGTEGEGLEMCRGKISEVASAKLLQFPGCMAWSTVLGSHIISLQPRENVIP